MKIKKIVLLCVVFIMLSINTVFANTNENIRVGLESLYKGVTSCIVTNSNIEIGYSENNALTTGAILSTNNSFFIKAPNAYFIKLPESFVDYNQASLIAQSIPDGVVGYDDHNVWSVMIYKPTIAEANAIMGNYPNSSFVIFEGNKPILYDGNSMKIAFTSDNKKAGFKGIDNEYINVGSRNYRGYIEVYTNELQIFTLVNVVPTEEYLYSVVPSEMPSSWNLEALKAQTVAARTYASVQKNKHASSGFNLCDNIHCQMYLGVNNENVNTTNAVLQTYGQKAYYNGSLIDTVFSSSSGGVTAASEDVWVNSIPYLREKKDPYDTEGLVWTRQVTTAELTGMLGDRKQNIGTPVSITIDEVTSNGRVNKITIVGTNGSYSTTKESIRSFFSWNGTTSLPSRLFTVTSNISNTTNDNNSTNNNSNTTTTKPQTFVTNGNTTSEIDLSNAKVVTGTSKGSISTDSIKIMGTDSSTTISNNTNTGSTGSTGTTGGQTATGTNFVISGRGYGHGVGLSQYGAKGMAEAGYSYIDILKFYYNGIDVY